ILFRDLARVRVDDRCRGTLVFTGNRRNLTRKGAIDAGRNPLDQFADGSFVISIVERPEKRHGQRLDLFLVDQKPNGSLGGCFVELLEDSALVVGALGYADDAIRIDQRRRTLGLDRVLHAILRQAAPAAISAARREQSILEAACCNESGTRAVARENR